MNLENTTINLEYNKTNLRRRGSSIDEHINEYNEYLYNNSYNMINSTFLGLIKLICPCFT